MGEENKGFSLVEILVAIGVVGILMAVVFVATTPSRNRGKDARIIAGVEQAMAIAESIYNPTAEDGKPYGAVSGNPDIAKISGDISSQGSSLAILTDGTYLVLNARLRVDENTYYCADNKGASRIVKTVPSGSACPAQ